MIILLHLCLHIQKRELLYASSNFPNLYRKSVTLQIVSPLMSVVIHHFTDEIIYNILKSSISIIRYLFIGRVHDNDVKWAPKYLKSHIFDYSFSSRRKLTSREISKLRLTGPSWRESTGDRTPLTRKRSCAVFFHRMTLNGTAKHR